jgi:cobalamin-dependent methionine synthase I
LLLPACRYLTLAQAQAKSFVVDWKDPINKPVRPAVIGTKVYKAFPIEDVVDYIDWNPFFQVRCMAAGAAGSNSTAAPLFCTATGSPSVCPC